MSGFSPSGHDPATDRAVALIGKLETHKTDEPQIAEPMERMTARLIDLVVWFVILVLMTAVASSLDAAWFPDDDRAQTTGERIRPDTQHPLVGWGSVAVIVLAAFFYEVPSTASSGRHFAKHRMGLHIVSSDGVAPGWRRAAIRWVTWWVPLAIASVLFTAAFGTWLGMLGVALQFGALAIPGAMFFDNDHRGLHDRIAGTRVLSDR